MRGAIKPKTDITEITRRVAEKLGCPVADVKKEINLYWVDVDMMFTHCCGYGTYVEGIGHFNIYPNSVYHTARTIIKQIHKKLKMVNAMKRIGTFKRTTLVQESIADLMTRLILLNYSVQDYKNEVLTKFPKRYKLTHQKDFDAAIAGMAKLFKVSLDEFPITISNPAQEMYVRRLRRKGVLRNPVVSNLQTFRGNYRKVEDPEV